MSNEREVKISRLEPLGDIMNIGFADDSPRIGEVVDLVKDLGELGAKIYLRSKAPSARWDGTLPIILIVVLVFVAQNIAGGFLTAIGADGWGKAKELARRLFKNKSEGVTIRYSYVLTHKDVDIILEVTVETTEELETILDDVATVLSRITAEIDNKQDYYNESKAIKVKWDHRDASWLIIRYRESFVFEELQVNYIDSTQLI